MYTQHMACAWNGTCRTRWALRQLVFGHSYSYPRHKAKMSKMRCIFYFSVNFHFFKAKVGIYVLNLYNTCLLRQIHWFSMKITNKMRYIDEFMIPSWLYKFRTMFSPIVRSTWLYLQYLVVFSQVAASWCLGWFEIAKQFQLILSEHYPIL
jgi:hypothetical protein